MHHRVGPAREHLTVAAGEHGEPIAAPFHGLHPGVELQMNASVLCRPLPLRHQIPVETLQRPPAAVDDRCRSARLNGLHSNYSQALLYVASHKRSSVSADFGVLDASKIEVIHCDLECCFELSRLRTVLLITAHHTTDTSAL